MKRQLTRRVVVSGVGLVCPLGVGNEEVWTTLLANQITGISRLAELDSTSDDAAVRDLAWTSRECQIHLGGRVPRGSGPGQFDQRSVFGRLMDKEVAVFSQFAVLASDLALSHARLRAAHSDGDRDKQRTGAVSELKADRAGVSLASGIGALEDIAAASRLLGQSQTQIQPARKLSPYFVPKVLLNMAAGQVSIRHHLRGPVVTPASACAAGSHAIGDAYNLIRLGYSEVMLAGGAEAGLSPLAVAGFSRMRALSHSQHPQQGSRPFDRDRDGFVLAEGAAVLVLEELQHALDRQAPIVAELVGYGLSGDAHHVSSPAEGGGASSGASRAMQSALTDAGLSASLIDYINAHATSTPLGDRVEAEAISALFGSGSGSPWVSSTKGATGHMLGAAGAVEAAFTALAVRDDAAPATFGLRTHDFSLRLVQASAVRQTLTYAMSNSFGFGGTNSCLIFKKFDK